MALLDKYLDKLKTFGHVSFKSADGERKQGGGKAERYALLNENQAYFVLNLSRNSELVVNLKLKLIQVLSDYRRMTDMRRTEYLPTTTSFKALFIPRLRVLSMSGIRPDPGPGLPRRLQRRDRLHPPLADRIGIQSDQGRRAAQFRARRGLPVRLE